MSTNSEATKFCLDCGTEKPLSEYYVNKNNKDGHVSYCPPCSNARSREYYLKHRDKRLQKHEAYGQTEKGKAVKAKAVRKYMTTNPDKDIARQKLRYAVSRGTISKQPCERCQNIKVDAHHHNGYEPEHWLDVMWLCRTHHAEVHRELRWKTN